MKRGYIVGVLSVIAGLIFPPASYPEVKGVLPTVGDSAVKVSADSAMCAPGIRFDSAMVDFGEIDGNTVRTHSFVLTNDGTAPLVIAKVYSDCGCTTAAYPKEPVMPGDTARIEVAFNPTGRSAGYFTKLVRIRSNASSKPHRLYIKGKIRSREGIHNR